MERRCRKVVQLWWTWCVDYCGRYFDCHRLCGTVRWITVPVVAVLAPYFNVIQTVSARGRQTLTAGSVVPEYLVLGETLVLQCAQSRVVFPTNWELTTKAEKQGQENGKQILMVHQSRSACAEVFPAIESRLTLKSETIQVRFTSWVRCVMSRWCFVVSAEPYVHEASPLGRASPNECEFYTGEKFWSVCDEHHQPIQHGFVCACLLMTAWGGKAKVCVQKNIRWCFHEIKWWWSDCQCLGRAVLS